MSELEALAEGLNPEMYRRLQHEIAEATQQATVVADEFVTRTTEGFVSLRDELLADGCELRDDYAALIAEGEMGSLTATEYADRFHNLERRKRQLARRGEHLIHDADVVATIEEDPVAWVDSTLYSRYPDITPEFSF